MNYKRVIEDFSNGTIDPNLWLLYFDNDEGYWCYIGPEISEDDDENNDLIDKLQNQMDKEYGTPDGYHDIVDLAKAAGINADWV